MVVMYQHVPELMQSFCAQTNVMSLIVTVGIDKPISALVNGQAVWSCLLGSHAEQFPVPYYMCGTSDFHTYTVPEVPSLVHIYATAHSRLHYFNLCYFSGFLLFLQH